MSSVLHPVGPEPEERYWVRRVAVIAAVVVAVVIILALVNNATSAGSAVQAEPAPPTLVAPPETTSPTPTPALASDTASGSASPTPSGSATASASGSPTPTATSSASSKASESSKTESKAKKTKKTPVVYPACDADDIRTTLTGDRTVKVKKDTTFALSLINGGKKTCRATADPDDFTLTIVSGSDRIWSTKDCPKAQPSVSRVLLPEHALEWKVKWGGDRSAKGCSSDAAAPKKGYYWAIANADGAKDVRFRLILS